MTRNLRRIVSAVVFCAATACSEPEAAAPEEPPTPVVEASSADVRVEVAEPLPDGLADAQARLRSRVREHRGLDVRYIRDPADLSPPRTIDFGWGNGHGGTLQFVRLQVGPERTTLESVSWQAYRRKGASEPPGAARRAQVATAELGSLLDGARALSRAMVVDDDSSRSRWRTSHDFFVLFRICGADVGADLTWEYAGYQSGSESPDYAAIDALVKEAKTTFARFEWTPVPTAEYRTTCFSDVFVRNRELFANPFHWWVMERSVEALGWFGNRTTLAAVEWTRNSRMDFQERQKAKLDHVRNEPEIYLEGPPKAVPEH